MPHPRHRDATYRHLRVIVQHVTVDVWHLREPILPFSSQEKRMRKLKLDLAKLSVDSFDAGGDERLSGTVDGLSGASTTTCLPASESGYTSCGSCYQPNTVCADTCYVVVASCGPDCAP
jgi:hypothetical protein